MRREAGNIFLPFASSFFFTTIFLFHFAYRVFGHEITAGDRPWRYWVYFLPSFVVVVVVVVVAKGLDLIEFNDGKRFELFRTAKCCT